jgi:hypothetical protein
MIPASWLLADVKGAKNALYVKSYALGSSMYYGAGAGMMPTAMAVVSDLIEVARNIQAGSTGALPLRNHHRMVRRPLRSFDELRNRYYALANAIAANAIDCSFCPRQVGNSSGTASRASDRQVTLPCPNPTKGSWRNHLQATIIARSVAGSSSCR